MADVFIEYVLRFIYQLGASMFTLNWDRIDAKVIHASAREGGGFIGCALTRMELKYNVDGKNYTGKVWNFFLTAGSEERWRDEVVGNRVRVRVSPSDPGRTFFCFLDQ